MAVTAKRRASLRRKKLRRDDFEGTKKLQEWRDEADRRARYLTAREVWRLLEEHEAEAHRLRVYAELRDICFVAAARFADPRMAKIVRCHRQGREVPENDTEGGTTSEAARKGTGRGAASRANRAG